MTPSIIYLIYSAEYLTWFIAYMTHSTAYLTYYKLHPWPNLPHMYLQYSVAIITHSIVLWTHYSMPNSLYLQLTVVDPLYCRVDPLNCVNGLSLLYI
jgi:hypothetical protein